MPRVNADAIPEELQERNQWLLWDAAANTPRRPHWRGNFSISWSDPNDWHTFQEAIDAAETEDSWGIGYVMALENDNYPRGLYGCIDIDGGLRTQNQEQPKDWVPSLEDFINSDAYVEYSPSGTGFHIPIVGHQPPDWWRDSHFSDDEHEGIEYLTNKFVTFTGNKCETAGDNVTERNPTNFLFDAYEQLNGQPPRLQPSSDASTHTYSNDDEYLTDEDIEDALDDIDPDVSYTDWRDLAFAVHSYDSSVNGKQIFEQWSKGGQKFDSYAQRQIDWIWDNADPNGKVGVGTLVHHAKQNGWSTPNRKARTSGGAAVTVNSETGPEPSSSSNGWADVRAAYAMAADPDTQVDIKYARREAGDFLQNIHHWRNLRENDDLYYYDPDNGTYDDTGDKIIREHAHQHLGQYFSKQEVRELREQVRGGSTVSKDEMGGPDEMIAAANGVIVLDETPPILLDHDPAYNFYSSLNTEYDPDAECPVFREFLDDVVTSETDKKKLQEFTGYTLMHWSLRWHKALFIVGPQNSGKSTFAKTITKMLGKDETVSNLSPQEMVSRFGGANLYGKWANIRNDIPADTVKKTGTFKEIIGGDRIKAEKKGKDPFFFKPKAKHMFVANQLPDTENDDAAFYRRILLVAFPRTVPRDERDRGLGKKLEDELPGILNWALAGLHRLREQDGFTGDLTPHLTAEKWDKWGHTVDRFARTCLNVGDADVDPVSKSEMYSVYQSFCEQEEMPCVMQQEMTRRLKTEHSAQDGHARVDGENQRVFTNVAFTHRADAYRGHDDDGSNTTL